MVAGEVLGQLEASVLVVGHDAVHDAGLLEDDEVAVDAALREVAARGEDLGDRERSGGLAQHGDEAHSVPGHPLIDTAQADRDLLLERLVPEAGRHGPSVPSRPVDPTERFRELVRAPEADVALAEAALCIAAHDHAVDIAAQLSALDDLAHGGPVDPEALARHLFTDLGFAGNVDDYGDPRNSFLDEVLRRRLGIPITLSVVLLEVGRRRGVALFGVGMPGHFLVGCDDGSFYDPFHGGVRLDEQGCRLVFEATRGSVPFRPEYLAPVGSRSILARMLANLVHAFASRSPADAVWATRLRLSIPGLSIVERREGAALLGRNGCFVEAATELEALATELPAEAAERLSRDAVELRARAN